MFERLINTWKWEDFWVAIVVITVVSVISITIFITVNRSGERDIREKKIENERLEICQDIKDEYQKMKCMEAVLQ